MFLAGRLYFSAQIFSLAGVPVTIPARRQNFVVWSAGAIWLVLRLPKPSRAKPSFLVGSWARAEVWVRFSMGAVIAIAPKRNEVFRNWRRDWPLALKRTLLMRVITPPE